MRMDTDLGGCVLRRYAGIFIVIFSSLAGCAKAPPTPSACVPTLSGALSVRQNNHVNMATFVWQQFAPNAYRVKLSSALGLYQVTLTGFNGQVRIKNRAPNAALLPVNYLQQWLRHLPATRHYQAHYDVKGHLTQVVEAGWQVDWLSDSKMVLTQLSQQKIQIRLAIGQWQCSLSN